MLNLATFIDAPSDLGQVPAGFQDDSDAWRAYLQAIRNATVQSWNRARRSYMDLTKIGNDLGVPVTVPPGEAAPPGPRLSADFESQLVEVGSMVTVATKFADEALANQRRVVYVSDEVGLAIEALPSDTVVIGRIGDRLRLVDRQGQPVMIADTTVESIGQLGVVPVIVWVAGAAVAIAVVVSAYFALQAACDAATSITRQVTAAVIEKHSSDLIKSGQSTPEQEQKRIAAVYSGAAQVAQAEAEIQKAKTPVGTSVENTIKTFLWVGLGVAVLYGLFQIMSRRPAMRPAVAE